MQYFYDPGGVYNCERYMTKAIILNLCPPYAFMAYCLVQY
jgi:hypothetical protein